MLKLPLSTNVLRTGRGPARVGLVALLTLGCGGRYQSGVGSGEDYGGSAGGTTGAGATASAAGMTVSGGASGAVSSAGTAGEPPGKCAFDGVFHEPGETFTNGCTSCTCTEQGLACEQSACVCNYIATLYEHAKADAQKCIPNIETPKQCRTEVWVGLACLCVGYVESEADWRRAEDFREAWKAQGCQGATAPPCAPCEKAVGTCTLAGSTNDYCI